MKHFNVSNLLSLCRAPLAFLFIPHIRTLRVFIVLLAAASDFFDGFLARRWRKTSQLGAVLDPVMDKLFMFTVLAVLLWERILSPWAAVAMLSRDLLLAAFLAFLGMFGAWRGLRARSPWWGKVITAAQYLVLLALVTAIPVSGFVFLIFPVLGLLYLGELVLYYRRTPQ